MRTLRHCLLIGFGLLTAFSGSASIAMAKITEKDVLVISRVIGLLENGPKGRVSIAIVTDGPASQSDAQSFDELIGMNRQIGNLTFTAEQIRPEAVATTNAKVILIPGSVSAVYFNTIFDAAQRRQLVTISTADTCLVAKRCAIAIKSDPAVDIRMSQSVAAATGVHFGSTLRMMIKEVP